ncbi:MAG: 5'/3'-nucleotidase SurE [Myxococcales bacterium]|nr:5'/3'-nucleotidase SurE [Myxococcales bacterium]
MAERPVLLLTNDDGIQAKGLSVLRQALLPLGHVVVVAPAHEQSASSHAITLDRPLRHVAHATDVHSIDGTPADCVYLGLFEERFLPRRPDAVISGINHGVNLGTSVYYSGTVAGAREAALRGIPSMAFSKNGDIELPWIPSLVADMVERLLRAEKPASHSLLMNVNFPEETPAGIKVARVGRHVYEESIVPRVDPGGREYFWIGGRVADYGQVEDSDKRAVDAGYVSVTPLALEPTADEHLDVAAYIAGPDAVAAATSKS